MAQFISYGVCGSLTFGQVEDIKFFNYRLLIPIYYDRLKDLGNAKINDELAVSFIDFVMENEYGILSYRGIRNRLQRVADFIK